jgi:hypothetical protein
MPGPSNNLVDCDLKPKLLAYAQTHGDGVVTAGVDSGQLACTQLTHDRAISALQGSTP